MSSAPTSPESRPSPQQGTGSAEGERLTHLDAQGRARMIDVSPKPETSRVARATALVSMQPSTWDKLQKGTIAKGDALAVARLAGIQGAKQTSALIPLCHPLRLTDVHVAFDLGTKGQVRIESEVRAVDRTGVEMEAMTAVSVAALALYDMIKGVDRTARVDEMLLLEKLGGKTGHWVRPAGDA